MTSVPPPYPYPYPLPILPGEPSWKDIGDDGNSKPVPLAMPEVFGGSDGPMPDTPIMMKASLQPELHGSLSQSRVMTMDEIGPYLKQIPIGPFLEGFLPPLQQGVNLDDIISHLKTTGEDPILKDHGWRDLLLSSKAHEDFKYQPLESIVAAIIVAGTSQSGHASVLEYVQWPRQEVKHRHFRNTGLPDGYGWIPDPANPNPQNLFWHQLIFSAQFKKVDKTGQINNNNVQLCSDMAQIMRDDPTRRFCYGYTVEYSSMKLWYFDRSELVISEEFDYMTDPRSFCHFILSLALSASPWDIGIDTTMTRGTNPDGVYYDIIVEDKERGKMKYRTQKNVHYFQAEAPRGRCTRVWEARKLCGENELEDEVVILKDTWVDYDRDREGNIMEAVLSDLKTPEDRETLREVLLTVLCHGDVVGPDGREDSTRVVHSDQWQLFLLKDETITQKNVHTTGTKSLTDSGAYSALPPKAKANDKPLFFTRKVHYRIVFEEAGTPLHQVGNLRHAFKALWYVSRGLSLMHSANWVHRDLSAHNIIWYKPPGSRGCGKLCDFEYAKREDDDSYHMVRSGSNFFMAWETVTRTYHNINMYYDPSPSPSPTPSPVLEAKDLEDSLENTDQPSSQPTTASQEFDPPPNDATPTTDEAAKRAGTEIFRHNFLHDLESLWWIAVYFLFYKEIYVADILNHGHLVLREPGDLGDQKALATMLFHCARTDESSLRQLFFWERYWALYQPDYFKGQINKLLPPTIRQVGLNMNDIRITIVQSYARINADPSRKLSLKRKAKISSAVTDLFKGAYKWGGLARSLSIRPLPDLKYRFSVSRQPSHKNTAETITQDLHTQGITVRKRSEYSVDAEENLDDSRAAKRQRTRNRRI